MSGLLKTHKPRLIKKQTRESLSGISSLALSLPFCPRTVCDVSLSRVCRGKQKEVGSTGPAGACQLHAGVSPAHKGKQESVSVMAIDLQSDFPRCAILLLSCGLDVSSDRSLILLLPVATDVRLMDPCSEIMWGSSGRREKQLFFPPVFN